MKPYLPERGYASRDCRCVSTSGKLGIRKPGVTQKPAGSRSDQVWFCRRIGASLSLYLDDPFISTIKCLWAKVGL